MKAVFTVISIVLCFAFAGFSVAQTKSYSIRTVVIDPGHGGHDGGCKGVKSKEKDIALGIALKLGNYIEMNFTNIKVIYTRKTDVFVELRERAAIANNNKADVFICIHANAGSKEAFGTETFVMGLNKTEENLSVAKRENSTILMEENYKQNYDGFDPSSPEASIVFSLYQNAFLEQSLILASKIQKDFRDVAGRYSRGVKQAGFLVLYRTTMPSVLVETGFLTNKDEEKFLSSPQGQDYMASSIFRAFKEYKVEMEGNVIARSSGPLAKTTAKPVEKTGSVIPAATKPIVGTPKPSVDKTVPAKVATPIISTPKKNEPVPQNIPAQKEKSSPKTASEQPITKPAERTPSTTSLSQSPLSIDDTGTVNKLPEKVAEKPVSSVFPPTPAKKIDSTKIKKGKQVDPEIAARAADRAEYEAYRKHKLAEQKKKAAENKIRQEASDRLRKELEAKSVAEAEILMEEAEEQAKLNIELEQKHREDEAKARAEAKQKAQEDYEAKIRAEMEKMRKQVEEEYARKQAEEKARIAGEIKAKIQKEKGTTSSNIYDQPVTTTTSKEEPLSKQAAKERSDEEKLILEREAKARAIAIELTKKNTYSKPFYAEREAPKEKVVQPSKPSVEVPEKVIKRNFIDIPYIDVKSTFYTIQIVASPKRFSLDTSFFRGLKTISYERAPDGMYKYLYGKVYSLTEAITLQRQMREHGFRDAFIVAYSEGRRITLLEAKTFLKESSYNNTIENLKSLKSIAFFKHELRNYKYL